MNCNIYHDDSLVNTQQKALCDNYGYNMGLFLGPEQNVTYADSSYAGLSASQSPNLYLSPGGILNDGSTFNIGSMFEQWFDDTGVSIQPTFTNLEEASKKVYCTNDRFYSGFTHTISPDSDDFYAVQYDECSIETRWSEWSGLSDCSVTCGGGKQNRSRNCEKKVNGIWEIDNTLIGQDCASQDGDQTSQDCNTQCCPVWQTCDPDNGDCTDNENYTLGDTLTDASFGECKENCGPESVNAHLKCMCQNGDGSFEYGATEEICGVIASCDQDDISCSSFDQTSNVNTRRVTATKDCGHKCCTVWSEWSFSCDDSCVNCFSDDRKGHLGYLFEFIRDFTVISKLSCAISTPYYAKSAF